MLRDEVEDVDSRHVLRLSGVYGRLRQPVRRGKYRAAYLNRFTEFGGISRKHEHLIEYLRVEENIDIYSAKTVIGGFVERFDVYRALAELVSRERFIKVFQKLKVVQNLAQRRTSSRVVYFEEILSRDSLKALITEPAVLKESIRVRFVEIFSKEIEKEFREPPLGEPEVYLTSTGRRDQECYVITFDFPKQVRQSVWKHDSITQNVPAYLRFWVNKESGEITTNETAAHAKVFPLIRGILIDVLSLGGLEKRRHTREDPEFSALLVDGESGDRPIQRLELITKDTPEIERIEIVGINILRKLKQLLGEKGFRELLKQMRIRYISDGQRGFSELE